MQKSPDAVVKPLGFWVEVLGTAHFQCVICEFSLPAEPVPKFILRMCSVCFVFVVRHCTFVCIPQFSAILLFVLLRYKKAERLKQVNSSWNTPGMYLYWTGNRAQSQS